MSNRTTHILVLGLAVLTLAAGLILSPRLPGTMASHWNFQGEVDGTMPRTEALIGFPAMIASIYLLCLGLMAILPMRQNMSSFRPQLNQFFVGLAVFLAYLAGVTMAWNLGFRFRIEQAVVPGVAALFYILGTIMARSKRNWLFGIRTPWTLSSDRVWENTHRFGGLVFRVIAVVMLLGLILGDSAWLMLVIPLAIGSVAVVVYSYLIWRQEAA
jgi:uncharacterized membrane protein